MRVQGEAFTRRLDSYADSTLIRLSNLLHPDLHLKALAIAAETDTEEEFLEKLSLLEEEERKRPPVKIPTTEEEWEEIDRQAWEEYLRSKQN